MAEGQSPTLLDRFDKFLGVFVVGFAWLGGFAVVALMLHIIADVFLRYFFNSPLPATIEIVSYWWMIMIIFPAVAWTQRRKEHVEVTLVTDLMPEQHRVVVAIFARLLTMATVAALAYYGWLAALEQWHRGEIAMGSITILIWPMRFMVPLGMGMFFLQLAVDLVRDIQLARRVLSPRPA